MFSNKIFRYAFFISVFAHGVILFQNFHPDFFSNIKKEEKLEVSYIKEKDLKKLETVSKSQNPEKKEPFYKMPQKITLDKHSPPPFVDKESIFKGAKRNAPSDYNFPKPALIKPDIIAIRKKITLPPIDINQINNPTYISYYQISREKIKRAAYQNYTGSETGEVTLSFVISRDGYLKDLRLVEEKSSLSANLRDIALRSIKEASPFPAFPSELDYPQLSFNLTILFEVE